jgi:hypothetical protein
MIATLRRGKRPHITKLGDERKICKDYPGEQVGEVAKTQLAPRGAAARTIASPFALAGLRATRRRCSSAHADYPGSARVAIKLRRHQLDGRRPNAASVPDTRAARSSTSRTRMRLPRGSSSSERNRSSSRPSPVNTTVSRMWLSRRAEESGRSSASTAGSISCASSTISTGRDSAALLPAIACPSKPSRNPLRTRHPGGQLCSVFGGWGSEVSTIFPPPLV